MTTPITPSEPTVPGCAPQVPVHERPMNTSVNPANSWAAQFMELAKPVPEAAHVNDVATVKNTTFKSGGSVT